MNDLEKPIPLARSDALQNFRSLLSKLPPLKEAFGELIQVRLVMDASVVQSELRWRVRRRRDPNARSGLQEAIDSGTIVAFAPLTLKQEIEDHIEEIAQYAGVPVGRVEAEWHAFQPRLHFYEPNASQNLNGKCVDPDDLPYEEVRRQLGAQAVYTRDAHFQAMQIPAITVNLDLTLRNYARASSIQVAVKFGSGFIFMVSLQVLLAVVKACVEGFRRLPTAIKMALIFAILVALVHPKSREKIGDFFQTTWCQLIDAKSPLAAVIGPLATQFVAAERTVTSTLLEIQSVLPPTRKRSALVHARAICVVNREPLSDAEIERRMRNEGYVSTSRNFRTYLRRVLRSDQRFSEVSSGMWEIRTERLTETV